MNAEFFALAFIAALNPKLLALDLLRSSSFRLLTRIELLAFGSLRADVSGRCHDAYVDQFEAEVGDPLY